MYDDRENFKTASLPLASFLYAKGEQVLGILPSDTSPKKEFMFAPTSRLEELVQAYKFGDRNHSDLQVGVHKYDQCRNELLDRLND